MKVEYSGDVIKIGCAWVVIAALVCLVTILAAEGRSLVAARLHADGPVYLSSTTTSQTRAYIQGTHVVGFWCAPDERRCYILSQ